ncbi:MAG: TrmH family RNA methyltransferase, partial [Planctomycetota bacterium]
SSSPIHDFECPPPLAVVLGHETVGIDDQVLSLADAAVEIPMYGAKHSHNVAVAAGIILAEVRRQWERRGR